METLSESETAGLKIQNNEKIPEVVDDENGGELFTRIRKNDLAGVKQYLTTDLSSASTVDQHGMSPLEHAAYRGNQDMCQILLDTGATVSGGCSNNGYTALHFAALSGNSSLCQLLLEYGARPHALNSIGRTAAQMAALVGNHKCVSVINTFIDRKDVVYYSVPHELETSPKLSPVLVSSLHNLVMQVNFHPVRVARTLKKNDILLDHVPEIVKVLSLMSEREIKKGADANEVVAFKLHLLSHILNEIGKAAHGVKGKDPIETFIKKILKCSTPGAIPENLDVLLRKGVQGFPFHETTIMQQLVTSLVHTKICQDPGAWGIICSLINGQKGFRDKDPCTTCSEEEETKKCSRCHFDAYCDKECQRLHWFLHKKYCKEKEEEYATMCKQAEQDKTKSEEQTPVHPTTLE